MNLALKHCWYSLHIKVEEPTIATIRFFSTERFFCILWPPMENTWTNLFRVLVGQGVVLNKFMKFWGVQSEPIKASLTDYWKLSQYAAVIHAVPWQGIATSDLRTPVCGHVLECYYVHYVMLSQLTLAANGIPCWKASSLWRGILESYPSSETKSYCFFEGILSFNLVTPCRFRALQIFKVICETHSSVQCVKHFALLGLI